ncbi:MAG: glycosyltransferase [Prevotella sp.]|nr:glycosyltransferase [Prevotella sp.]
MISVIVATYNQEQTIARTLDSILMQQCHEPVEIVIGEDCSTDGTLTVCRQYEQQHPDVIRVMANIKNKGVQANYFDCLLACRGEYIADCAGDDFWTDPLKLEKELTVMQADADVTLVHTAWNYYDETSGTSTKAVTPYPHLPKMDGKQLLTSIITQTRFPVIHLCTSLYRRDVIMQAYNADTQLFRCSDYGCEDLQVACALAHAGTIAYLLDTTLNYSVNHNSVSNPQSEERQFRFVKGVTALSLRLAELYHIKNKTTDDYLSYRIFALGMHAFRAHSPQLRDEVKQCQKEWGARPTLKYRLTMSIIQCEWTWKAFLTLRQCFVKFKSI